MYQMGHKKKSCLPLDRIIAFCPFGGSEKFKNDFDFKVNLSMMSAFTDEKRFF